MGVGWCPAPKRSIALSGRILTPARRRRNIMRTAYKVLAYLVAIEVAVQAAAMVFAIFGLGTWVSEGGVLDQAASESGESLFPEMVGFVVHGMNGVMVIPAIALVLFIVSFFAKVPRGVASAGAVLGLVVLQVALGIGGHSLSFLGLLHGINALALFSAALLAVRRVSAARIDTASRAPAQALT
jgi:hypothetical protein